MSVQKPFKIFRQIKDRDANGSGDIDNITYNEPAGAQKQLSVGPHLVPLNDGASGFTTDATTIRAMRRGTALAIFNTNATTVYAATIRGASTGTALASGVTDPITGEVGVPCAPLSWTYLNSYDKQYVITNNVALQVFEIFDESYITNQRQSGA
jgi:hypothetical protein